MNDLTEIDFAAKIADYASELSESNASDSGPLIRSKSRTTRSKSRTITTGAKHFKLSDTARLYLLKSLPKQAISAIFDDKPSLKLDVLSIQSFEKTSPSIGFRLTDCWVGHMWHSGLTGKERGQLYYHDFTAKGYVIADRIPLGRPSIVEGPLGQQYRVIGGVQLHGALGLAEWLPLRQLIERGGSASLQEGWVFGTNNVAESNGFG